MNKHCFTSIRKSFWSRLIKPFIGGSLFFLVVVFITKRNSHPLNEIFSTCAIFSIIIAITLIVQFYNVIEEVQIIGQKIIFIGHRFNARWEKELDINDAKIQIVSKRNGRGNVDYYLKISFAKNTFSVNRAFTWEYKELIKLFNFFKEIRKENITPTERWLLGMMDKKAKGYSSW